MIQRLVWLAAISTTAWLGSSDASAQSRGAASAAAAGAGAAPSGGGSLAGVTFTRAEAESMILPPQGARTVLCYRLEYGHSAAQPLVLEPIVAGDAHETGPRRPFRLSCEHGKGDSDHDEQCSGKPKETWSPCSKLDPEHAMQMRQSLVIGIDPRDVVIDPQVQLFTLNVSYQPGSPINPNPIRPSYGAAATAYQNAGAEPFFLTWPYALPGDAVPTVSVSMVFTPVMAGAPWREGRFYPTGSVVTPKYNNGHYYTAVAGGVSGDRPPTFPVAGAPRTTDNDIDWQDAGTTQPPNAPRYQPWLPLHPYALGDVILDPYNGHYFVAIPHDCAPPGSSCKTTSGGPPAHPFPLVPPAADEVINDGTVEWRLDTNHTCRSPSPWVVNHDYAARDCVKTAGAVYVTTQGGTSGDKPLQPYLAIASFARTTDADVEWFDAGTVPPASVSATPPPDQSVSLLNVTLPQIHSLSYFNLAAGLAVSTVRPPNNLVRLMADKQYTFQSDRGTPIVDPTVFLTWYIQPLDAERPSRFWDDFLRIPGLTVGVSLASPTSNFYVGGTSELVRNVELVYGGMIAKITELAPGANGMTVTVSQGTPSAPTEQHFATGLFVGLTFNVTGFIQGLSSGGGKGSGS